MKSVQGDLHVTMSCRSPWSVDLQLYVGGLSDSLEEPGTSPAGIRPLGNEKPTLQRVAVKGMLFDCTNAIYLDLSSGAIDTVGGCLVLSRLGFRVGRFLCGGVSVARLEGRVCLPVI